MSYQLIGTHGEANTFEKNIANFALLSIHESQNLMSTTRGFTVPQGNTLVLPKMGKPITFQDYNDTGTALPKAGNGIVQTPDIEQVSVNATEVIAVTEYSKSIASTAAFGLAQSLGANLASAYMEKVDQRVAKSFTEFQTGADVLYTGQADGFNRIQSLGEVELALNGSVVQMVRKIKAKWHKYGLPGAPVVVLHPDQAESLLGELTGAAVASTNGTSLSSLGDRLLENDMREVTIYGIRVMFSRFLATAGSDLVGAYYTQDAIASLTKETFEVMTGVHPYGRTNWITAQGYFGVNVIDERLGGKIVIKTA